MPKPSPVPWAELSVSADPIVAGGTSYVLSGSGFTPGTIVYIEYQRPGFGSGTQLPANDEGDFAVALVTGQVGTYVMTAFQYFKGQRLSSFGAPGAKRRDLASVTFTVI